jgi:enamine deaminase RidA (YjgF/YER057c/UK114 family)
MSQLKSYAYPGIGEFARENFNMSQAIRAGDHIYISGQGGWEPNPEKIDFSNLIKPDLMDEIDQAFANVDHALKDAGGKGWEQVYKIVSYHTDIESQHARVAENSKKWMPNHTPVWTEIGVAGLGAPGMHIEIDVQAYDEEGAKEASKTKTKVVA